MTLPSSLHARCMRFAKGIPAIGYSWNRLQQELDNLLLQPGVKEISNVPLPVRGLRARITLNSVEIKPKQRVVGPNGLPNEEANGLLVFEAIVEVYAPKDLILPGVPPNDVVLRRYKLRNPLDANHQPIPYKIILSLDSRENEAFWELSSLAECLVEQSGNLVTADLVSAGFAPTDPADTRSPEDIYLTDVEVPLLWTSRRTFLNLVVSVLPRIQLGKIAPWLSLVTPIKVDYAGPALIITSENASVSIKDECKTEVIDVRQDPAFPGLPALPNPVHEYNGHVAVYIPSSVSSQIHTKRLGAPIPIHDKGGGQINFEINGQIVLSPNRTPFGRAITNSYDFPIFDIKGIANFDGSARGCVDLFFDEICAGSGRIYGHCVFEGVMKILVNADGTGQMATIERTGAPHIFLNYPNDLPWPLSDVKAAIDSMIESNVVNRTFRRASIFNAWQITGVPDHYASLSGDRRKYTIAEGYEDISILVGFTDEG